MPRKTSRPVARIKNPDLQQATESPQKPLPSLSCDEAAQIMWDYYRNHKNELISHIREYRENIISQIRMRVPVESVFAPFLIPE
jgi:hypothetical protein